MNTTDHPRHSGSLTLIIGGARSGKSRFAQQLASELGGDDVLFVATGQAGDAEMAARIAHHQETRPSSWQTLECSLAVGDAIEQNGGSSAVVLIDCLTLLVSNVACEFGESKIDFEAALRRVHDEVDQLLKFAHSLKGHLIIVSGDVGAGVVPVSELGRVFRDLLGWANQRIAAVADTTFLMVAGLPINATSLACSVVEVAKTIHQSQNINNTTTAEIDS